MTPTIIIGRQLTRFYAHAREIACARVLMSEMFLPGPAWVLSGSRDSWGDEPMRSLDPVMFLRVPRQRRPARVRDREARAATWWTMTALSGPRTREGRNLARDKTWLRRLSCLVPSLDGTGSVADLVDQVVVAMQ